MTIYSLDILLSQFVPCPVLTCFLTCIQVSQGTGKVVWYYHLFKSFPQFVVIYTVKGDCTHLVYSMNQQQLFSWNSLAFSMIQQMLAIWSLVPLSLRNPAFTLLQWKHRPSRSLKNAFCCFAGRVKDRNYMFSWLQVWSYEEKMAKWHLPWWLSG